MLISSGLCDCSVYGVTVKVNQSCRHFVSIWLHLSSWLCGYHLHEGGKENDVPGHFSIFYKRITACEREETNGPQFLSALTSQKYSYEILHMKSFCLHFLSLSQTCDSCGEASFITSLKCGVLISGFIWRPFQTWALWEKEVKVGSRALCFLNPWFPLRKACSCHKWIKITRVHSGM